MPAAQALERRAEALTACVRVYDLEPKNEDNLGDDPNWG